MTGRSAYEDCTSELSEKLLTEISGDIEYHPMIEYPLDMREAGRGDKNKSEKRDRKVR